MDSQTHVQMKAIIDNLVAQKKEKNRLESAKQAQEKQKKAANTELVIPSQPNWFERFLESVWSVKSKSRKTGANKHKFVRTTIKHFLIYLAFMTVTVLINFGHVTSIRHYFPNGIMGLFLDTENVEGVTFRNKFADGYLFQNGYEQFWEYLQGPLIDGLYFEQWYDGSATSDMNKNFIFYTNKILGVPRMTQIRMQANSCIIPGPMRRLVKDCITTYSSGHVSKEPFGRALLNITSTDATYSAWIYADADSDVVALTGKVASYMSSGYKVDLPTTKNQSLQILNDLRMHKWIDQYTRAVIVDFIMYNANINLFNQVRLLVEFAGTGGIQTSWSFSTVNLLRYVSTFDYVILACEIIFTIFIVYYTIEEILDIRHNKCKYFKDFYNINDIVILILSYITISFGYYRTWKINSLLDRILSNSQEFKSFSTVTYWEEICSVLNAIVLFFAWIKIFKYIGINETLNQLPTTLRRCYADILGYFVILMFFFAAYGILGYLSFGELNYGFISFSWTLLTLFRAILGDFDFLTLRKLYPISGPLYFITFITFGFFVLLNTFFAIINNSYSLVKIELLKMEPEFMVSDFLKINYSKIVERLNMKKHRLFDMQNTIETCFNDKDFIDSVSWRTEMLKKGYAKEEIEAMFSKYDSDTDGLLNKQEKFNLMQDLIKQRYQLRAEFQEFKETKSFDQFKITAIEKNKLSSKYRRNSSNADESSANKRIGRDEFTLALNRIEHAESKFATILTRLDKLFKILEKVEMEKLRRSGAQFF